VLWAYLEIKPALLPMVKKNPMAAARTYNGPKLEPTQVMASAMLGETPATVRKIAVKRQLVDPRRFVYSPELTKVLHTSGHIGDKDAVANNDEA
jgi:hypothetical protein